MKPGYFIIILLIIFFHPQQLLAQKPRTDTLFTSQGNLVIHLLGHASVMFEFKNLVIHVDPYSTVTDYSNLPKADLILVTHAHPDHFDINAINKIKTDNTVLIYPQVCANTGTYSDSAIIMHNGDTLNILGLHIEAVPMYNITKVWHIKGDGNGYVINFGDKRIYIAGDTEYVPEMDSLNNIEVAFLPMSQPYNMTPEMLAEAARSIRPKILYPYHYDNSDPSELVNLLKDEPNIEVRVGTNEKPPTDIDRKVETTKISIFQNLSDNRIYINNLQPNFQISIYDINGKIVMKGDLTEGFINTGNIVSGIYLLAIRNNNNFEVFKFIKK